MMVALVLVVVVVVLGAVVVALHTGPHGMLLSGAVGVAAALIVALLLKPISSASEMSWALVFGLGLVSLGALVTGAWSLAALRRRPVPSRVDGLWGADGVALSNLEPFGTVRVAGETWSAESLSGSVSAGSKVHVIEVDGLHLRVWSDDTISAHLEEPSHAVGLPERTGSPEKTGSPEREEGS